MASIVDTYMLYRFIRGLTTPFKDLKLAKLGLIDDDGEWIVPEKDRTPEQRGGYTYYDVLILNLKKLIAKVPFGATRIATFAAALYLLKEGHRVETNGDFLTERLAAYHDQAQLMIEDVAAGGAPTNNMGGGQIADPKAPMKSPLNRRKTFKELTGEKNG